jgi:solute carrier family 25 carnitine/acylcarnitine transporter 20/29
MDDAPLPKPPEPSSLRSFISGGFGGACSVLVGYPLDLVKVQMQTATRGATKTTMSGVISETMRKEGLGGLFRGVSAPLFTVAPIMAVAFWGYDLGKRVASGGSGTTFGTSRPEAERRQEGRNARVPSPLAEACIAGAISALPTSVILGPTERIKCLLQVQRRDVVGGGDVAGAKKYAGTFDCARKVFEEGGIRSLFRGTGMMFVREIPGTVAYFVTYEYVKGEILMLQGMHPDDGRLSVPAVLVAGGLAGMAYWSTGITIVADVVKSRYQTTPPGEYAGYRDVYRSLVKEGGYARSFVRYRRV